MPVPSSGGSRADSVQGCPCLSCHLQELQDTHLRCPSLTWRRHWLGTFLHLLRCRVWWCHRAQFGGHAGPCRWQHEGTW